MAPENEQRKKSKSLSVPTDIIVALLLKLPDKSLLRCKSVCKLWNSLISDPYFVKCHLRSRRLVFSLYPKDIKSCSVYDFFYEKSLSVLEHDYPLKECSKSVSIVGSCNGLLCIVLKNVNDNLTPKRKRNIRKRNEKEIDTLFIWNPTTRRSSSRLPYFCDSEVLISEFEDTYGFGYDESSDDYKVVKVYRHSGVKSKVIIYSLKTGKWKHLGDFPHGRPSSFNCLFLNGAFHWFATLNGLYSTSKIISLDLEKATYGEVLQPAINVVPDFFSLGVLRESLCKVYSYKGIRADVWVMKVYGVQDSWVKLFSVPYSTEVRYISVPYFISNDGKLLLKYNQKVGIYDSKNNSFSEIMNFDGLGLMQGYTFVESLVSPDAP